MFFNKKLHLKIANLEQQLALKTDENKVLSATISRKEKEIASLNFKLSKPPKFAVGDKFGDEIITDTRFVKPKFQGYTAGVYAGLLMCHLGLNCLGGAWNPSSNIEHLKSLQLLSNHWEYELTNIKTGNKQWRKQFDEELQSKFNINGNTYY